MSAPAPQGAPSGTAYSGAQQQHGAGQSGGAAATSSSTNTAATAAATAQNLNQIVTDYLKKKGFTKTEAVFRQEISNLGPDGKPADHRDEDAGSKKYLKAFILLRDWIENGLDIYKFELRKLLWPIFTYSFLDLVEEQKTPAEAKVFLDTLRPHFEYMHRDTLNMLATITLPQHVQQNETTKAYRENKYRIPLDRTTASNLFSFLERETANGGATLIYLLHAHCTLHAVDRGPIDPFSFEAIYRRAQNMDLEDVDQNEGIPGVFTGIANRDVLDAGQPLRLGPLPMEPELRDDIRAELEEEDRLNPPADGRPLLSDEFERQIKREESADGPSRAELPLPPSRARDVHIEIAKVRENRDRFRIESVNSEGMGVPVSICAFTFHNTLGSLSCMDFSNDHQLVAIGTMDSYIRVWTLDGKPLKSTLPNEQSLKVNNRKLIGHSGPVYGVSFADAIGNIKRNMYEGDKADTGTKLLLSCSADGQVRLWSLEAWTCLCIYKGHDGPVMRVLWGPHGHYFASAGWDKTVRVWAQDHASALRLMVGHDTSISAIAWHPNGTYVFSASDETDKSIRMWSVSTGSCVRLFTGHADYISSLQVAPNGNMLASGDAGGNIMLWDIAKGQRIKRCRGHGKGGIPSLSFSVESTVLVSGGLDGTVRLWDVNLATDGNSIVVGAGAAKPAGVPGGGAMAGGQQAAAAPGDSNVSSSLRGAAGPATTTSASAGGPGAATTATATGTTGTGSGGGKKKNKEVQVTADQISAFMTKKTPVIKVQFTRMNLVVAGGSYDPER